MTFTNQRCQEIAETAYRRGYYQGAEAVLEAFCQDGLKLSRLMTLIDWLHIDVAKWRHAKNPSERELPPDPPKAGEA